MNKEFMEWLDAEIKMALYEEVKASERGAYSTRSMFTGRCVALEEVKQKLQEHHADDR